ncbi:MAG: mexA [Planctomycetaceae bacterium]|nr:mexA [Planctomycetaceae bacterium]
MSHIQVKPISHVREPIHKPSLYLVLCWGVVALGLVGCQHEAPKPPPPKPAEVMVSIPIEDTVTEFEEVTGRTWAVNTIEIRSRVSGYLDKVYFRDGSEIKAGELLFEIDQRPFKADLDRALAAVKQTEAHLERLVRQEERMKKLLPSKAITMDEFEAIQFERAEADAALAAAKAAEETANLNLGFTRVTSKISGTIGRRLVDPGNLVKADETALAAVVSLNPIYAYFDLDERTVLRLRRMIQQGAVKSPQDVELPAQVAVADDPNFTMTGVINFIDNQLDGSTGTLRGRAMIHNHDGLLSPGLFVRLRVPIGAAHKAILVREEALGSDQGQRFVYVIDKVKNKDTGKDEDVVAYRRVQIGMLIGGRRVIESGLALNERVIVTGLQRVRPGAKVQAKMVDKDGKLIAQTEPVTDKPAEKKTAEVAHGSGK